MENDSSDINVMRPPHWTISAKQELVKTRQAGMRTHSQPRPHTAAAAAVKAAHNWSQVKSRPKTADAEFSKPCANVRPSDVKAADVKAVGRESSIYRTASTSRRNTRSSSQDDESCSGSTASRKILSRRPVTANSCLHTTEIFSIRGSEYSKSCERVDIVSKVRAQSCRRRSAKLSSEDRTKIVRKHRQTAEEKVESYYQVLKERERQELELLARKALAVKRFGKAIWKVMWIIRWKRVMIAISRDRMVMTAMEIDWHTRNTDSSITQFKKEEFSKTRVSAKVPAWAEKLLRKPPEWRTESDCSKLYTLLRPLRSFEKFTEKIQKAMCKAMRYEFVDAKRIILRKGHPGLCFYFLYSGSAFVNVEDTNRENKIFTKTVSTLHRGDSFGNIAGPYTELALLRNTARTATITCREDCELLTVDSEVFAEVCPAIFEKEMQEKLNFIRELPIFVCNLWGESSLQSICFNGQIKHYKNDQVIVADSKVDDWMYICMQGKCRIMKGLALKEKLTPESEESSDGSYDLFSNITREISKSNRHTDTKASKSNTKTDCDQKKEDLNKVQMLNSMAVEWFRVHQQVEEIKQQTRDQNEESSNLVSGLRTLSYLMRRARGNAQKRGEDVVFVQVAEVHQQDVFDLHSILWGADPNLPQSSLILVSSGAKMLRIKRADFYRLAKFEALQYIKTITAAEKYPNDSELLQRYTSLLGWKEYRQSTVTNVLADKKSPYCEERKAKMNSLYADAEERNAKLLKALRQNEQLEQKRMKKAEVSHQRVVFLFELEKINSEEERRDLTEGADGGGR